MYIFNFSYKNKDSHTELDQSVWLSLCLIYYLLFTLSYVNDNQLPFLFVLRRERTFQEIPMTDSYL